jgi:hypothetical protein
MSSSLKYKTKLQKRNALGIEKRVEKTYFEAPTTISNLDGEFEKVKILE